MTGFMETVLPAVKDVCAEYGERRPLRIGVEETRRASRTQRDVGARGTATNPSSHPWGARLQGDARRSAMARKEATRSDVDQSVDELADLLASAHEHAQGAAGSQQRARRTFRVSDVNDATFVCNMRSIAKSLGSFVMNALLRSGVVFFGADVDAEGAEGAEGGVRSMQKPRHMRRDVVVVCADDSVVCGDILACTPARNGDAIVRVPSNISQLLMRDWHGSLFAAPLRKSASSRVDLGDGTCLVRAIGCGRSCDGRRITSSASLFPCDADHDREVREMVADISMVRREHVAGYSAREFDDELDALFASYDAEQEVLLAGPHVDACGLDARGGEVEVIVRTLNFERCALTVVYAGREVTSQLVYLRTESGHVLPLFMQRFGEHALPCVEGGVLSDAFSASTMSVSAVLQLERELLQRFEGSGMF